MKSIKFKLCTSRKSLSLLSVRQKSRVMSEIRDNLRFKNCCKSKTINETLEKTNICNVPDIFDSATAKYDRSDINCLNDNNIQNDDRVCFSFSSSSSSIDNIDDAASFFDTTSIEFFRERLASCFIDNNLTHVQGNNILAVLRTHPCLSILPKDVRTLLDTPRNRVVVSNVEPGEYVHFDLEARIIQCLTSVSSAVNINQLEIDISTDGCALDKSGSIQLWPIQVRIANIQHTRPIVVGIYKGTQKPHNPNSFFEKFIIDIKSLMSNGGINFHGRKVPIHLRSFIADAPARAFILNHRGHTSNQPCSKCKVSGTRSEGRYVFNGINHPLRTDQEYIACLDEDHHKEGRSPLSVLPIGMVSQVPFEYMHLICLGVMKKLLVAWVFGKYSRLTKLSGRSISIICARLDILKKYCPSDFARRPRSLDACSKYKATEFRQFLLYTGPVVAYGILDEQVYKHFLFLHAAVRILISNSPSRLQLNLAEVALQKFVQRCESLYGSNFSTYNVHGLLHVVNDVRLLGSLDSFSAFPYESNMSIFRKYCRKPGLLLQQFANRMRELEFHGTNDKCDINSSIRVSLQHSAEIDKRPQYRKIMFKRILLSVDTRDNCCLLRDGSVCIVLDIIMDNNSYILVVKKFLEIGDFYNIGISSSSVQVYKCSMLGHETFRIHLEEVCAKCYKMPFWTCTSMEDSSSDEETDLEMSCYVVLAIIHTQ